MSASLSFRVQIYVFLCLLVVAEAGCGGGAIFSQNKLSNLGHSVAPAPTPTPTPASAPPPPTPTSVAASRYDGPAELPRVYINSAMVNTPAHGKITILNAGASLQNALDSASCGDTIELQAGATFTGSFTLPAKRCDDTHWIIIRTNASNSALPPEQARISPCYAGVSSLPSRPAYSCPSPKNVMAKIIMSRATGISGPLTFAVGANHYRLIGLEITRQSGNGSIYNLAQMQYGGPTNHIIFDRVWMHGTSQDETQRAIYLGGSTYVAVIDSYLSDFHCVSVTGACGEAQAIGGGTGNLAMGPYKIVDNFLEASSENILLGGGAATFTPADLEIRQNHFYKPRIWQKGQPGYVGGQNGNAFVVKNHFEVKNAQRVLFEANILEYTWGGFSQAGFSVLLTPKNQNGQCPNCQVTDITVRYNTISHVAAGFQIANGKSDSGAVPLNGERYSVHDVTVDDINATTYLGPGSLAQVSMADGTPILRQVVMNHITAFPERTLFYIGNGGNGVQMQTFTFMNSIVNAGSYPVWSTGGGSSNCAFYNVPLTTFGLCFNPYLITKNAVIGSPSAWPAWSWPSGNDFPSSVSGVRFVNYNGGNGGNYQLQSSSPYRGAASDGKDMGADMTLLNQMIAGVR
jgi:hypothetical protein